MKKDKNIVSIYDTDFNQDLLNKAIDSKPELEILKFLGEIRINLEDSYEIGKEDNRFSAHNELGNLANYGSIDSCVKDLKIMWEPTIEDVEYAKDADFDDVVKNGKVIKSKDILVENKKSTLFIKNVINSKKEIDITDLIKSEKIQELEEYILENFADSED